MKMNDAWLKTAIDALTEVEIVKEGLFNREFKGYISSFGAAVIQSGLLPAVMFFENKSGSQADKPLIIKAIVYILTHVKEGKKHEQYNISQKFADYLIDNTTDMRNITLDVNNAATCLKLALRIFEEKSNSKNGHDGK